MRYLTILAVLSVCVAGTMRAQDSTDSGRGIASKKSVEFDGETLVLAFQDGNDEQTIEEYLPEGQKLDSWTRLAAIYTYAHLNDSKDIATELVRRLEERNPAAPHGISENRQTGEVIVDFVVWPDGFSKPEDAPYVEFNIFKYGKKDGGGLIAEQYALREYRDIKGFLGGLKPVRKRLLDLMATKGLSSNSNQAATEEQGDQNEAMGEDQPEEPGPDSDERAD